MHGRNGAKHEIKQSGKRADPTGQYTIEVVLLVSLLVIPAVVHVLANGTGMRPLAISQEHEILTRFLRVPPYIQWSETETETMDDALFLALAVAFFAATIGLAYLFESLREHK